MALEEEVLSVAVESWFPRMIVRVAGGVTLDFYFEITVHRFDLIRGKTVFRMPTLNLTMLHRVCGQHKMNLVFFSFFFFSRRRSQG